MKKENNNKLIYKINGKEYLLIECAYSGKYRYKTERDEIIKIGGIEQGVGNVSGGLFCPSYFVIRYLIPTNKLDKYHKITSDDD